MKVLIIECMDPFLPKIGGTETYSRNLLDYLSKTEVRVALLGVCYGNRFLNNSKLNFIPIARKTSLTGYEYFFRLILKTLFMRIPVSTIIHAQRPNYILPFILFHRKNPRMVTLHGQVLEGIRLKRIKIVKLVYEIVESFTLKHSRIIIAVDEATKEFYQHQYPQIATKIKVLPVGIDLTKFKLLNRNDLRRDYGFRPNDKIIVYVGRLEKEKGLDFLIDCFTLLVESVRTAILVFVGDGRDRERLENLVMISRLKNVIFKGTIEPDRIPEILNCADVLALCSFFEGSPTVIKEALACGVPVVSTNVGDVSQIIRSEATGRIVVRNKESFSRALVDVLLREDREQIRTECAGTASNFSFEQIGAMTVDLYKELLVN